MVPQPKVIVYRARGRLLQATGLGVAIAAAMSIWGHGLSASTIAIASWDLGSLYFLVRMVLSIRSSADAILTARREDEGAGLILALVLFAALASIGAVAIELSEAKTALGVWKGMRVAFAFSTVMISWLLVHFIFALHYVHRYFRPTPDGSPSDHVGGLAFPGGELPDFWDFLHFSIVIGVASQTADIGFTRKDLRRLGTVHGMVAFVFNTAVLALGINLVAGLF